MIFHDLFHYLYANLQGEAVQMIVDGTAPRLIQPEEGATYDAMLKKALVEV